MTSETLSKCQRASEIDQQLVEYLDDFKLYSSECLTIRDHNTASLLNFEFNAGQDILHDIIEKRKHEKGYVRALLLKSRRFGGSTYVEARYYWQASMNENRNVFIVAHEEDSTATLFGMAKLFHEKNPIAPSHKKSNSIELIFDNSQGTGLKSQYRLATARNVDAGRSQGVHYLHASEEAFWDHGDVLLTGLLQCVPDPPAEHEIIRESTANGYGNSFQEDVFATYAEGEHPYYTRDGKTYAWENPKNDWILIFIPWFAIEKYTKEFDSEADKESFVKRINKRRYDPDQNKQVDSEELCLMRRHNLTLEQLHWREWAIEAKCRGSLDLFKQEYPATVNEAFLSKGSNVFPSGLCDDLEAYCQDPIVVGDVVTRGARHVIRRNKHGAFSVWERPDEKESYFITCDVAGGKKERHKALKQEPDYTVVDVWNHRTGVQVAQWHGHIDYDMVGDLIQQIGSMFFQAPACVERNNHGLTVVADLKRAEYPQYYSTPEDPGWTTTAKTKPVMVDSLYRAVRVSDLQIRSAATVAEMRTYIEENQQFNAAEGCKDDRVITAAIASQMITLLPKRFMRKRNQNVQFKNIQNKE